MDQTEGNKLWVQQWLRVGPLLAKIEHDELRAFCFATEWKKVDGLLQLGFDVPNVKDRNSSGLVEQQRLFSIARR